MATSLLAAIEAVLEADATLVAILTGGVYNSRDLGAAFINETDTPAAFGTLASSGGLVQLKPCAVVSASSGPTPVDVCGRQEWVKIGVYDKSGYANTEAALDRIHALLNDTTVTLTNGANYEVEHIDTPFRTATDDTVMTGTGKPASYEAARYRCTTTWA